MPACHVQSDRVVNLPAIQTFQRLQILSELSYCAFESVSGGGGVRRPFMSRFIRIVPRRARRRRIQSREKTFVKHDAAYCMLLSAQYNAE